MAVGFGLLIGPIFGGLIYSALNYFWCYFFLAILVFCDMIFTWLFMPNIVNKNESN
jgi:hypothetical protein